MDVELTPAGPEYDVIVVGAGMGGIYGIHRFRQQGLSVIGIEAASDVGGVWFHNAYPGARVDIESDNYCYFFDPELYQEWQWSERYAAQPEILRYLNHVADKYGVRDHIRFNTRVESAVWDAEANQYAVTAEGGDVLTSRFLVMATGQLSKARKPAFDGIDDFQGEWVQSSQWRDVPLEGKRVGVIGTGSSGVQAITVIGGIAEQTYVFQRTANYSIPAQNRPADSNRFARLAAKVPDVWDEIIASPGGLILPPVMGKASDFPPEQRQAILEERWAFGGQSLLSVFSDQGVDPEVNEMVSEFVRQKSRKRIDDPVLAEKLMCTTYPIGVRRICIDTGYYERFNQDNVHLVDIREDPIERITQTGIQLRSGEHIDLDTIVFALGFNAFTGALDNARVTNERGRHPSDRWARGPRTFLGLTTCEFPNLFIITGPASPSVLSNMNLANVQHMDFVGDLIAYMDEHGYTRVEPTKEAEDAWTDHAYAVAEPLLRRAHDNYMVHVNQDDGTRVFIPYAGGVGQYVEKCKEVVANDYEGFSFK
ncbi:NAD(P)/FAD-dependent oxidoreductase [Rhodococcus erythropolis]|uniref:flavin-containing monooxygenase n=1 Tax=Rhodococcus erythropolis TaxID=1833 RepID=UPI00294A2834|nr:NAD(P)/FAD-dependent oxidoreductase [Rhodococcus erythropolis]MDV6212763.1 NAD(P)/FAD-dependent oxidoreductase [Rhodococcus erythropolis]